MSRGGAEREGDTESEAGSRLGAASTETDARLDPSSHEIVTRTVVAGLTNGATEAPLILLLILVSKLKICSNMIDSLQKNLSITQILRLLT